MLKALELVGFKSFADKTRFEFPRGITVVVGPNGSGKSNVVDAIKWVLGEQSVKSLRGREMADVIFNGSGTRKAVNSAEITLTLDNSSGKLAVDTPEVYITRRVYRSGEGEYLLNRQPCRLRDIRDLLSGTGMSTDAYCIIEQGKVDVLLQSSARDRRVIFEEAAGISRFKAKKIEAQRRLERVDQNLLRLGDIVEEVESRLRSVRAQAGKARRYKEYTDRLQDLRTQVGLVDWRRLSERLAAVEQRCTQARDERDAAAAEVETLEAALLQLDTQAAQLQETLSLGDAQLSANRERIAAAESTIEHERARLDDLEEQVTRHRRQLGTMNARAGDLRQQMSDTSESVAAAEAQHREIAKTLADSERRLTETLRQLDRARSEHQQIRDALLQQLRAAAARDSQISALESQAAAAEQSRSRIVGRVAEVQRQVGDVQSQVSQRQQELTEHSRRVEQCQEELANCRETLAEVQQRLVATVGEATRLRQRQAATAERVAVLEELEQRQEGVNSGVKAVLAQARSAEPGPLSGITGMVADLFQVGLDSAPPVEAALGPLAQCLVAPRTPELLAHIRRHAAGWAGRVGFVWRDWAESPANAADVAALEGLPGVVGRADRFVEVAPADAPLVARLLAGTWIVEDLSRALELAPQAPGLNLVTLAGELLQADGTLLVGPRDAAQGLISRRSQLRALKTQLAELEANLAASDALAQQLQAQTERHEAELAAAELAHQEALNALGELRFRIAGLQREQTRLAEQHTALVAEQAALDAQWSAADQALQAARAAKAVAEAAIADAQGRQTVLQAQVDHLELEQREHTGQSTDTKVELAKSEERLYNLQGRLRQFEESQQERQRAISESRTQLEEAVARARQSRSAILRCESETAELYLRKETLVVETRQLLLRRNEFQAQRTALTAEVQKVRGRIRKLEERLHGQELEANEVRLERSNLVTRLRDDYSIDLAQYENAPSPEQQHEREQAQQEIDELRRKINQLGNVNLEALDELEQLESRHTTLSSQYKDLTAAKGALEKIIEKINTDSRKLFADTLQTVKEHFQTLFRDLFGGGRADIILDEGVDLLESGIEIVARPPGKEPRSISLLSGGEKTLTCVALLLAIFRSRPSPFCVLDEVDAALDEANIDRFTKVLQDFLAWTQFVIVTHSKKTMTCASTIYGVTMQESGVSKQVSVRFEDVSEDGAINPQRVQEAAAEVDDEDETQAA